MAAAETACFFFLRVIHDFDNFRVVGFLNENFTLCTHDKFRVDMCPYPFALFIVESDRETIGQHGMQFGKKAVAIQPTFQNIFLVPSEMWREAGLQQFTSFGAEAAAALPVTHDCTEAPREEQFTLVFAIAMAQALVFLHMVDNRQTAIACLLNRVSQGFFLSVCFQDNFFRIHAGNVT